jgi:GNAT superfamily N-acetyltransferase
VSDIAADLQIAQVTYSHPDSVALTDQVQNHYREIYGGPDSAPMDVDEFVPPHGAFFVAYDAGIPVGMGGWRFYLSPLDLPAKRPAEIKRMYVVESARRRGVARRLLAHLEATALAAGADALVLETGRVQPAAIALYRANGYVDIPRFGHYALAPSAVHLGKLAQPYGSPPPTTPLSATPLSANREIL